MIFSQYPRRERWEADHSNLGSDTYGAKIQMPRLPRSRCIDFIRYLYLLAWAVAFGVTLLGPIVVGLAYEEIQVLGFLQLQVRRGSEFLFAAWILVTVVGVWRLIYKIASDNG